MKKAIIILLLLCCGYAHAGNSCIYPDFSNVPITGGTINGTTIGATTPAAGTFTVLKGNFPNLVKAATGTLVADEMNGQTVNNYGQTDDVTLTMDAGADGLAFNVLLGTAVAKYFRLDPTTVAIYLDGTSCGAGKYVGIASAVVGAAMSCKAFQTGASTYDWYCAAISGDWACE